MKRLIKYKNHIRGSALALMCLLSVSAFAQQRPLFQYITNPQLDSKQQHYADAWIKGEEVIAHSYIAIDEQLFNSDFISLNLPSNQIVSVEKRGERLISKDMYSWFGNITGLYGNADFVVHGKMITGRMSSSSFVYQVYPITGGLHVLIQTGNYPNDESEEGYKDGLRRGEESYRNGGGVIRIDPETNGQPESLLAGDCKVRVLVAYTDDFANNSADPIAFVNSCIDATNTAYNSSAISYNVELAVSIEVNYAETLNSSTDKTRFRNTADGYIDEIHDYRTYFDADLNVLLTENLQSGICGEAYTVANSPYADAFCVCKRTCAVGNLSFPHELGHLYGARHDTYVDNNNTPYAYGHGYVYLPGLWRTIMAYNDYCDDNGTSCTRIQRFSNPALTYNGNATGVSGVSDNESAHESSRANISSLETTLSAKSFPTAYTFSDGEQFDALALTSINAGGSGFTLNSGSSGTFRSGGYSVLVPGFWAKSGSKFNAFTDECTTLFAKETNANIQNHDNLKPESAQVQPNPFTDQFDLVYNLAKEGKVTVILYDMLGAKVQELLSETLPLAGPYKFTFNAGNIKPGIYTVSIGSESGTKNIRITKAD